MSALVIDPSAALSWCFEDEASAASDALFEQVRDQGAFVRGLPLVTRDGALITAAKRSGVTGPA